MDETQTFTGLELAVRPAGKDDGEIFTIEGSGQVIRLPGNERQWETKSKIILDLVTRLMTQEAGRVTVTTLRNKITS